MHSQKYMCTLKYEIAVHSHTNLFCVFNRSVKLETSLFKILLKLLKLFVIQKFNMSENTISQKYNLHEGNFG